MQYRLATIRNTPLLVQIFIVYFGLASVGLKVDAFTAATAALVINVGAYTSEIVRAGVESIPRGQLEAAECLALSRWQILRTVVLPPAIERVYPALTSQYVLLMLASSITSQISAEELTAVANRIQSETFRSVETYLIVAAAYLVLSLVMRLVFWCALSSPPRRPSACARAKPSCRPGSISGSPRTPRTASSPRSTSASTAEAFTRPNKDRHAHRDL